MKQRSIFVLFLTVVCNVSLLAKANQKPVIHTLEDFFRFENVDQVSSYFGAGNVYTETAYYGNPNTGGKLHLITQVNFGTPHQALLVWNREGNQLCEVQSSAYYYDFEHKKIKLVPNKWKTRQGIHAGMHLSGLVAINWFAMYVNIRHEKGDSTYGNLVIPIGWVHTKMKVPYSPEKLIFSYTLDLKRLKEFFPKTTNATLRTNNLIIRKWDPMLELITIYRDGLKPDH